MTFQFKAPPPKVPVKAICLAMVLFIAGSALIVIGALLLSGYIESKVSHWRISSFFLFSQARKHIAAVLCIERYGEQFYRTFLTSRVVYFLFPFFSIQTSALLY